MRQLTFRPLSVRYSVISKLPMRQLTKIKGWYEAGWFSKLPMRQLTFVIISISFLIFSKLPMRQLTRY